MKPPHPAPFSRRQFLHGVSLSAAALALPRAAWGAEAAPVATAAAPPVKKLGVALAGLGGYSTGELAPALQETKLCELRGVVTRSPQKGAQWAQRYSFPAKNIYSPDSMGDLANNPDIDIVYVVTPNGLHAEYAILAAMAGKHVICEKPMANTVAECDAILRACAAKKRTLAIGYRLHFDPYHQEMMRLAADPAFGPFTKMTGENGFTMNTEQWRMQKKLSGGGPLMDMGIYVVHAACMAANANPVAVTARERPKTRPNFFKTTEEALDWTMEFPGGGSAQCFTSYSQNVGRFRAETAKGGWLEMAPAFYYRDLKAATSNGPLNYPPVRQQALQMDGIARSILDGKPTDVPGELGRRDMVIIEGIYKSAALDGKRVELDYSRIV